ncbi:hypothetical protein VSR01_17360 [Actinacidiphila sp. DG2A-62]|uniref:hypothetical protein n=1 Tax=Actinacidiphila sp. DG2A-62 TaxID=3108821 RepID=UPI002DB56709|nr:hypothetical protein [Actinacidiphila sp. DG2A-62]MEC3995207.1 hypothetical protein [Actinacidiphila sp. DG2A-62]
MKIVPDWMRGGNDRQLAADLATKKQIKRRIGRAIDVRDSARAGQAWEDNDRRQERERHGL